MYRLSLMLTMALTFSGGALAADAQDTAQAPGGTHGAPPIEAFLRRDDFQTVKISPNGEYVAASVARPDHGSLVILRRSDLSVVNHANFTKDVQVADFNWVSDKRLLFSVGQKQGELVQPRATGEIYAMDADGKVQYGALVGARSGQPGAHQAFASVIDTLHAGGEDVLISQSFPAGDSEVDRMDIMSGHLRRIARSPVQRAEFLVDAAGVVRFATGAGDDNRIKTFYRTEANSDWQLINDEAKTELQVNPVGFSADGKTAYLQSEETDGPDAVYAFDTATRTRTLLYRDPVASPNGYLRSPEDHSVFAINYGGVAPHVHYLDPDNRYAKQLVAMQANFPGSLVLPTSYTRDGAMALYVVTSDRIASDFYMFDRSVGTAGLLLRKDRWFTPDMLSPMHAVEFKARDGLAIHALLTVPRGSDGANLPLVVNPHGGPFGISDEWGYNPEVQLLASRGYAVLQVNYRGSGGYGRAFMHAGYRQWGRKMQDDLTDATHWAIEQKIADPKRICIYGASYGGYAALEGVAKEPSLYRCAIGYVGVYDMPTMYHEGDIQGSHSGENFLKETLGDKDLDAISPTRLAERIVAPVMMVAGKEDQRAPAKHTEMMRDALKRAGKSPDVKIYDGEGHGFYTDADRLDLYTRMLAFLDRYIGSGAQTSASSQDPVKN